MKYCEQTTLSHPISISYSQIVESIQALVNAEGCRKNIFAEEKALNLDKLERCLCTGRRSPNPTMDAAIGLSIEKKTCKMLLVDFKFDVKQPTNLGKAEIEGKINNSKTILSQDPPIHRDKILIFNDALKAQAERHIARLYNNKPTKEVVTLTIEEFKQLYF